MFHGIAANDTHSCTRDAPSAVRTASSRVRVEALASSRFVRLAHATSSTNPTAALNANNAGCTRRTTSRVSGVSVSRTSPVR